MIVISVLLLLWVLGNLGFGLGLGCKSLGLMAEETCLVLHCKQPVALHEGTKGAVARGARFLGGAEASSGWQSPFPWEPILLEDGASSRPGRQSSVFQFFELF